jgi:hypothetical protein
MDKIDTKCTVTESPTFLCHIRHNWKPFQKSADGLITYYQCSRCPSLKVLKSKNSEETIDWSILFKNDTHELAAKLSEAFEKALTPQQNPPISEHDHFSSATTWGVFLFLTTLFLWVSAIFVTAFLSKLVAVLIVLLATVLSILLITNPYNVFYTTIGDLVAKFHKQQTPRE